MAGKPLELPAFIQLRLGETGAFSRLKSEVADVNGKITADFANTARSVESNFNSIAGANRQLLNSLGVGDMSRSLDIQRARAAAAEQYAAAANRAAAADAGQTRELRQAAAAAEALAIREREAATAAAVHADAIGRVSAELKRETGSTESAIAAYRRMASANDNGVRSAGAHRMAMTGLGQQLQDSVVQLQMGTSALTVFVQQGSQAAYQMAGMGGAVGAVARTLAGPWGAALFAGTAILGPFITGLLQAGDAADEMTFGTNAMSDAQSILGNVLDIATGKINTQSGALLGLAQAQILVNRVQAQERATEARRGVLAIQDRPLTITGGMGGGLVGSRRRVDARDAISQSVLEGEIDGKTAVQRLDNLRKAGRLTDEEFTRAATSVANLNLELENIKTFDKADQLLNGTGGRDLLKLAKPTKDRDAGKSQAEREAEQMRKAGDAAAESIARINERFDRAPRLIDQTARATRELDAIIADLSRRDVMKFKSLIADAEAAKDAVEDALLRPIEEMQAATERRLEVQDLLARGRDDEASALQAVWSLEDKLGSETELRAKVQDLITAGRVDEADAFERLLAMYPSMKRQAADLAEIEVQRSREAERQRGLFEAQVDVLRTAQSGLTGLLSGRKVDLFGDIGQSLKDLQGARLSDQLFGDMFQGIEDELRQRSPLGRATERLVSGVDTASTSVGDLAAATDAAALSIVNAANRIAMNDNTPIAGYQMTIGVTGQRPEKSEVELARLSAQDLADRTARGIVTPLTAKLEGLLGTRFSQMLTGVLSGAMGGYLTGGAPGGVLGALKGGVFEFGPDLFGKGTTDKVLSGLDGAMGGASTGTMAAGLMKSLGIKTSTTGAQIGGALGSFAGPVGSIAGSIAGGLLGGLFKSNRTAGAVITGANGYTVGGKDTGGYEAASGLGDSVIDGLKNIAEQLDGTLGSFMVSIGTRGDEIRVNTGSSSLKGKNGAKGFGDDAEAAIKFAISDAIKDGALLGIRKSTQALLQGGTDLDAQLKKAMDWEGAFKELRASTDPLGAALDDLDKRFEGLIGIGKEAGASLEEMADLEMLYGMKRAEIVKEQNERILGSLQGLYDDLTIGDNGLSLRDRRGAAMGKYDELAGRVASGDTTAYDDYAQAAKDLLDIERQIYGSQQAYFDRLNEVTDLTKTRIGAESNVVSITENRDSPFDSTGAVKSSIDSQTDALVSRLDAVISNQISALSLASQGGQQTGQSLQRLTFGSTF